VPIDVKAERERHNLKIAVETIRLEYSRGKGNSSGALKCVYIGKNTDGESTLLGYY